MSEHEGTRRLIVPPAPGIARRREPPTFSVVIPAYQAAETIGEAIRSALEQTAPPLEIVVCDDGSTDDLDGAVRAYRNRIRLVRQRNLGGAAAVNTACSHASGEFIAILDADDAYLPERLEALSELACDRPDLDLLATNAYFERDGEIVGHIYETRAFPVEDQRRSILEWCFLFAPAIRRTRLLAAGGFDESLTIGYDWDCWLRLILDGATAGLVDEPLISYRLVAGSLADQRARSLRERVAILAKAASRTDLTWDERRFLSQRIAEADNRARLAEAREALHQNAPAARRRAYAVAVGPGMSVSTRAKAALAVAFPRLARRVLEGRAPGDKDRFPPASERRD